MKMKGKIKANPRLALTIFFAIIIFFVFFLASLIAGGILFFLIKYDLPVLGRELPRPEMVIFRMMAWSTVLGVILSFILSKISLRPVNRVIDAMNMLAHGEFKTRLEFHTIFGYHPTATEVADSFNHMAEELEKTEMLRSDFVNNFSHEFKTPIVSIAGFADLLLEEKLTDEEKQEYLRIISEESHRLSDMATNVLNLTKIENQAILTNVTRFNISEQIRNCLLLLESKWTEKDLMLDVDFAEYQYSGNREMLQQVWLNLIDNAVKFADPGGILQIDITETPDDLFISVSDTGQEIPQESISHIFNKFYQADKSHAAVGNGIGLSIVKAIIELHGGKVIPMSDGRKTVFTVVLPKM
ncbi:MAG: HAMP domain-containing histidine kinase [Butyrivibrio sp.]|nr:HAMP domain-containing histidine kinase [Butyrivibrio sp.]